jgi:Protein of unknown function (DUF2514)
MLKVFDIVPGWVYALIIAGALAAAGVAQTRFVNERGNHAATKAEFATARADAEAAARTQSEKYRAIEQELRNAQDQNAQQAEALLAALAHARTVDRMASERVRDAIQDAAAVARSRCAAAPAAGGGPPGTDIIGLFAQLLGSVEDAAGQYAAEADERRIRGLACERAYDKALSVQTPVKSGL